MGKGRAAGWVSLFVGNRGLGQLFAGSGPRKVTRGQLWDTRHVQLYIVANGKVLNCDHVFTVVCMDEVKWKVLGVEDSLIKVKKLRLVIYIVEL